MTKTNAPITKGSGNIYQDLGFSAEVAQNMLIRTDLMISIIHWYKQSQMTQATAAKQLGISQPRLNLILKSDVEAFSLDALVNIAVNAGLIIKLSIKEPKTNFKLGKTARNTKATRKAA